MNVRNRANQENHSDTTTTIRTLYEHRVAKDAFYNSEERLEEANVRSVNNIAHRWTDRLNSLCPSNPDQAVVEDLMKDIITWLRNQATDSRILWVYDDDRKLTSLIGQTAANILAKQGELAATYFYPVMTFGRRDLSRVVPTIAYQLTRNIPETTTYIADTIAHDLAIFDLNIYEQVTKLLVEPLKQARQASEEAPSLSKAIIIHGLEDCENSNSISLFLDAFVHAWESTGLNLFSQKLLIFGRPTDRLRECLGELEERFLLQHPIHGYEAEDNCRRVQELGEREEAHSKRIQKCLRVQPQVLPNQKEVSRLTKKQPEGVLLKEQRSKSSTGDGKDMSPKKVGKAFRLDSLSRPFEGDKQKFIIAINVGTAVSRVAFCLCVPGEHNMIRGVNRFPGQEHLGGDAELPSIVWYDESGNVVCAGAEATCEGIDVEAAENQWLKAEWFTTFFHPWDLDAPGLKEVPPLPLGKTVMEVYADILRYIFSCTKKYVQEFYPEGRQIWEGVKNDVHCVLTHPNGYEVHQQGLMRQAAVLAGLVPDQEAAFDRISLITEGIASLHYCIDDGVPALALIEGKSVMVINASNRTLEFSSYSQKSQDLMEIAPSQCIYNGGDFITTRAKTFFQDLLKNTRFEGDVDDIAAQFDRGTKPTFRDPDSYYYIRFGAVNETQLDLNIRNGVLRVHGADIAKFFEPTIDDIVGVLDQQMHALVGPDIAAVFLVGAFAASNYLFETLKQRLSMLYGIEVYQPDCHGHGDKTVAYGAVSHYVKTM